VDPRGDSPEAYAKDEDGELCRPSIGIQGYIRQTKPCRHGIRDRLVRCIYRQIDAYVIFRYGKWPAKDTRGIAIGYVALPENAAPVLFLEQIVPKPGPSMKVLLNALAHTKLGNLPEGCANVVVHAESAYQKKVLDSVCIANERDVAYILLSSQVLAIRMLGTVSLCIS